MRDDAVEPINPPRPLTAWEDAILQRLAPEASDAAIDNLRLTGRCICGCMSIAFEFDGPTRLAGEAEALDDDGIVLSVSFLTDMTETHAAWLEIQRPDGGPVKRAPDPAQITILSTSHWGSTHSRSLGRHS